MLRISKTMYIITTLMLISTVISTLIITFSDGCFIVYDGATLFLDGLQGEKFFNIPEQIIAFISRIIFIYGLYRLCRMLSEFSNERYFSKAAIKHLRAFAGAFAFGLFLQLGLEISSFLWHDDQFESSHAHRFNLSQLFYLIFSATFFMIGHVLSQARKNEEELDRYF